MVVQVVTLKCKNCSNNFDTTSTYNEFSHRMEYDAEYCDYCNFDIKYKNSPFTNSKGNKIPNPNLVTEVTLEDIANKFGVDVKNLKIKK